MAALVNRRPGNVNVWAFHLDVAHDGDGTVLVTLPTSEVTVGRNPARDPDAPHLQIVDDCVSRLHCALTALPVGGIRVRDCGSTGGTYVNGGKERVLGSEPRILQPGEEIVFGRVTATVSHGR